MKKIPSLNVAGLLKRYGLRPHKGLGQNFLQDEVGLEKIVEAADIQREDVVLEIGPGLGSLTRYLAAAAQRVVAVELDQHLLPPLREVLAPYSNVQIVTGDILELPVSQLVHNDAYLVVANIPYYITSAVIRHLLEGSVRPRRIVLTVQKDVAQRICAGPGDMSILALSVQVYGKPEIVAQIPAGAFYPAPSVDSAVLKVELYPNPLVELEYIDRFFQLVKAGFSQKRKTLRNSLSAGMHVSPAQAAEWLQQAQIDPQRRAETLSLTEWDHLARSESTTD